MKGDDFEEVKFDEGYWAFIYLIAKTDKYLTLEGRILKDVAESGACCESVSKAARKFDRHIPSMCKIFHELEKRNHIKLVKKGRCKVVRFNKKIINEALKLPYGIVEDEL